MTGDSGFSELFYYNIFIIYLFCLRADFVIKKILTFLDSSSFLSIS